MFTYGPVLTMGLAVEIFLSPCVKLVKTLPFYNTCKLRLRQLLPFLSPHPAPDRVLQSEVETCRTDVATIITNLVLGTSFGIVAPLLLVLSSVMAPFTIIGIELRALTQQIHQHNEIDSNARNKPLKRLAMKKLGEELAASFKVSIPNRLLGHILTGFLVTTLTVVLWDWGFALASWLALGLTVSVHLAMRCWVEVDPQGRLALWLKNKDEAKSLSTPATPSIHTVALDVAPSITVSELKCLVSRRSGIAMDEMVLMCGHAELDNPDKLLQDYVNQSGQMLRLMQLSPQQPCACESHGTVPNMLGIGSSQAVTMSKNPVATPTSPQPNSTTPRANHGCDRAATGDKPNHLIYI